MFLTLKIWLDPEKRAAKMRGVLELGRPRWQPDCGLAGPHTCQITSLGTSERRGSGPPLGKLCVLFFALQKNAERKTQNQKRNNSTNLKILLSFLVFLSLSYSLFVCILFVCLRVSSPVFIWYLPNYQFISLSVYCLECFSALRIVCTSSIVITFHFAHC